MDTGNLKGHYHIIDDKTHQREKRGQFKYGKTVGEAETLERLKPLLDLCWELSAIKVQPNDPFGRNWCAERKYPTPEEVFREIRKKMVESGQISQ